MRFLSNKIYFPDTIFILYAFLAVCALVALVRFADTRYTLERFYNLVSSENISREEKLTSKQEVSIEKINRSIPQVKYEAEIVTFVLWGVVGITSLVIWNSLYKIFINPFYNDVVESHYIHANKKSLVKKRVLWILSTFFTFGLIAMTIYIFQTIVLPLYTISTYATSWSSIIDLAIGVIFTTLSVIIISLGLHAIYKTY